MKALHAPPAIAAVVTVTAIVTKNLSALALTRVPAPPLSLSFSLIAIHGVGLVLVAQLMRVPLWIVAGVVLFLMMAQLVPRAREIITPTLLAPFWFVYTIVIVRFVWLRILRGQVEGYFEYALPDARTLLHFEFAIAAAVAYSGLILFSFALTSRGRAISFAAIIVTGATLIWAAIEYLGHRTFGASGSDPFAYVQMGIDLVSRGTPAHQFPLFPLVSSLPIAWFPLVQVGYHLPHNLTGESVSVWPPWGALAYGLAYRLGGETWLYLVNPISSIAGVLVSGLLAWELTRSERRPRRLAVAALTSSLVATSNEIVNWAGVTMVDTQALVFSTLAFYCALRVYRTGAWSWAVGAGVFWGFAYLVRHTQLVLLLGLAPLVLFASPNSVRLRNLVLIGITALLVALPDLWYHQIYLGSWLTPESEELALFSVSAIPGTAASLGQSALIGAEFGWLLLFVISGVNFYTRREKVASAALLLWLGASLLIHLPYPALRLRDLIPEFPILAFYAGYGVCRAGCVTVANAKVVGSTCRRLYHLYCVGTGLAPDLEYHAAHPAASSFALWRNDKEQRAAFDEINARTPQSALIGASLNTGAVEFYAARNTFRPADWCNDSGCAELRTLLATAQAQGRTIYLLEDNASLNQVLDDLKDTYQIEQVTLLNVPLFGETSIPNPGALWRIER